MDDYERQYNIQSRLQQEQIEGQQTMNAPFLRDQMNQIQAQLLEQLNPANTIDEIELVLRGEIKSLKTGEVIKKGEPLMNELGINKMLTFCRGVINQNTTISFLEANEIGRIMIELSDDLVDDLSLCWKEYGITSKPDLDYINDIILTMCFCALKRALNGGERNFMKTTTTEILNSRPQNFGNKKEGFLNKFKL